MILLISRKAPFHLTYLILSIVLQTVSTFAPSFLSELLVLAQAFPGHPLDKGPMNVWVTPRAKPWDTLHLALINLLLAWLVITSLNWCREQTERINTQTPGTHITVQCRHHGLWVFWLWPECISFVIKIIITIQYQYKLQ